MVKAGEGGEEEPEEWRPTPVTPLRMQNGPYIAATFNMAIMGYGSELIQLGVNHNPTGRLFVAPTLH